MDTEPKNKPVKLSSILPELEIALDSHIGTNNFLHKSRQDS